VALAALLLGVAAPARADFVIDDFSSPNPGVLYDIPQINPNPFAIPPQALGGGLTRTGTVEVISGTAATGVIGNDPRTPSLGSVFELSTPASSTAVATLNYNYSSPTDFSALAAESLVMSFTFADLNVPYSLTLRDADGGSATVTGLASSGPGTYATPLSAFAGVNLSRVSGLDIVLNRDVNTNASTTSADFVLDEVRVPTNPVPAPPAVLLALAVLPVLGLRRMLRPKAAG
jgi:hypothetical protein